MKSLLALGGAIIAVPVVLSALTIVAELVSAPSSTANFAGIAMLAALAIAGGFIGKLYTGDVKISFRRPPQKGESQ